ncbi:hypothetical protein CHUAL_001066 [Chamberlinius hualienensis]
MATNDTHVLMAQIDESIRSLRSQSAETSVINRQLTSVMSRVSDFFERFFRGGGPTVVRQTARNPIPSTPPEEIPMPPTPPLVDPISTNTPDQNPEMSDINRHLLSVATRLNKILGRESQSSWTPPMPQSREVRSRQPKPFPSMKKPLVRPLSAELGSGFEVTKPKELATQPKKSTSRRVRKPMVRHDAPISSKTEHGSSTESTSPDEEITDQNTSKRKGDKPKSLSKEQKRPSPVPAF